MLFFILPIFFLIHGVSFAFYCMQGLKREMHSRLIITAMADSLPQHNMKELELLTVSSFK